MRRISSSDCPKQIAQRDASVFRRQVEFRAGRDRLVEVQPPLRMKLQQDGMKEELREGRDAEKRMFRRLSFMLDFLIVFA